MASKSLELPEKLSDAIEGLIRTATSEKFAIIGLVFKADPPSLTVIRNVSGDSAELFHMAGNLVQEKVEEGLIIEHTILPLN